jgi:hypothetical protein
MRHFRGIILVRVVLALSGPALLSPETRAGEPSPEYRASLRRTLELRKQHRAARDAQQAVGLIVPFPMPPSLIIRQTREAHDEIEALLRLLRGLPR